MIISLFRDQKLNLLDYFFFTFDSTKINLESFQNGQKIISGDKNLNHFSLEFRWEIESNKFCDYGVYLRRERTTRTLEFVESWVMQNDLSIDCTLNQNYLNQLFESVSYYASKRGTRYIAVELEVNDPNFCPNQAARLVFDRRAKF